MKILSFDQSTNLTGYCLTDNGTYIISGVIDKHKNKDTSARVIEMARAICTKIKEYQPDYVVLEDVQQQASPKTVIYLARLQGGVMLYCASKNIKFDILGPSHWRSKLQFRLGAKVKREELKQQSLDYVKEHYGFEDKSDDECDAICLNVAMQEILNNTK